VPACAKRPHIHDRRKRRKKKGSGRVSGLWEKKRGRKSSPHWGKGIREVSLGEREGKKGRRVSRPDRENGGQGEDERTWGFGKQKPKAFTVTMTKGKTVRPGTRSARKIRVYPRPGVRDESHAGVT